MGEHVKEAAAPRRYRVTFLSVIGELLITIAVILGLFAVWQLYWTTYKVEGPRAQAVADFSSKHPSNRTLGERHTDDPPEFTLNPAIDELYGVIHVPSWNWMKIPLGEGTTGSVIDQGWAGHYKDTAQPGQVGNFSVAAHRRSYGNSFRFI
ncbi:MAG: class E sortase, partial [Actinomyces sp. oral taxon 181]